MARLTFFRIGGSLLASTGGRVPGDLSTRDRGDCRRRLCGRLRLFVFFLRLNSRTRAALCEPVVAPSGMTEPRRRRFDFQSLDTDQNYRQPRVVEPPHVTILLPLESNSVPTRKSGTYWLWGIEERSISRRKGATPAWHCTPPIPYCDRSTVPVIGIRLPRFGRPVPRFRFSLNRQISPIDTR